MDGVQMRSVCTLVKNHIFQYVILMETAKRSRRLLIVDGHSSHVNLQFIESMRSITNPAIDFTSSFYTSFTAARCVTIRTFSTVLYQ